MPQALVLRLQGPGLECVPSLCRGDPAKGLNGASCGQARAKRMRTRLGIMGTGFEEAWIVPGAYNEPGAA